MNYQKGQDRDNGVGNQEDRRDGRWRVPILLGLFLVLVSSGSYGSWDEDGKYMNTWDC